MTRSTRTLALAGALALLTTPSLVARDRFPFELTIKNPDKKPVEAAAVTLTAIAGEPFKLEGATDRKGRFRGELPDFSRTYRLVVHATDFATYDQNLDLAAQNLKTGQTAEVAIQLDLPNAPTSHNEGLRAVAAGDLALAEAKFREAISLDAKLAEPYLGLAEVLRRQKRMEESVAVLEQGAAAVPSELKIFNALGFEQLELKHFDAALGAADRALALAPTDPEALRNRYDALIGLGRTDEAETALDAIAEKDPSPETARLLYNAGATASNAKQFERARHRLGQALTIDPKLYQAHAALAEIAIGEKDFESALAELDKTLALSPRNFKAFERKIEVLRALGREADATAAEEQLKALRGN